MLMLQFSAADSVPSCRKSSGQADRQTDGRTDTYTHTTRLPYAVAPPLAITTLSTTRYYAIN